MVYLLTDKNVACIIIMYTVEIITLKEALSMLLNGCLGYITNLTCNLLVLSEDPAKFCVRSITLKLDQLLADV